MRPDTAGSPPRPSWGEGPAYPYSSLRAMARETIKCEDELSSGSRITDIRETGDLTKIQPVEGHGNCESRALSYYDSPMVERVCVKCVSAAGPPLPPPPPPPRGVQPENPSSGRSRRRYLRVQGGARGTPPPAPRGRATPSPLWRATSRHGGKGLRGGGAYMLWVGGVGVQRPPGDRIKGLRADISSKCRAARTGPARWRPGQPAEVAERRRGRTMVRTGLEQLPATRQLGEGARGAGTWGAGMQ